MVNEKRNSFWEQQAFSACVAVVVSAIAVNALSVDVKLAPVLYLGGTLYGMLSYECWRIFLNNFGSMIYEEEEEPERLSTTWAVISLALPVLAVIVVAIGVCCLLIGTVKYYYDKAWGRIRSN